MSEQRYDIFFRGEVLEGFALETVKASVAQLFKASPDKIDQLFSGKVVPLRKDLDKATAAKFKQALDKAGAKIYIKLAAESSTVNQPQAVSQQTSSPQASARQGTSQATTSPANQATDQGSNTPAPKTIAQPANNPGNFIILPAGSDVLRPDERPAVEAVKVDISGIRMASVFDMPEIDTTPSPPPPNTSHISAAPVGADILEGVKKEAPPPPPDVSSIKIAAPGADMSEMVEKIPVPAAPDVSHISTAAPGANLLEGVKKESPPPAPDVSHIHLAS